MEDPVDRGPLRASYVLNSGNRVVAHHPAGSAKPHHGFVCIDRHHAVVADARVYARRVHLYSPSRASAPACGRAAAIGCAAEVRTGNRWRPAQRRSALRQSADPVALPNVEHIGASHDVPAVIRVVPRLCGLSSCCFPSHGAAMRVTRSGSADHTRRSMQAPQRSVLLKAMTSRISRSLRMPR